MKRYILFIIIILLIGCDLFKSQEEPDNPPRITNRIPAEYLLTQKIGDTINFKATANDADEDPIEYKTLKNGVLVNDTNTLEFIIDKIGGFLIQIIAYNTESDTAEWYVSVENQQPIISYMGHVNKNEDEIIIGEVVKSPTISDLEDDISELSVELSQTNSDLIKLVLDSNNQIIVDDYQNGASGFSQVQYRVTDTGGYSNTKGFHYIINPMTDIEGNILDSDTWEPNAGLQGFVIIHHTSFGITKADTVWADVNGMYKTQIEPEESIDIEAGYRSLDKTLPMSFITTARNVSADGDINDVDIIVVTYLNNNMTPEEFRILAYETNFSGVVMNYHGAKVPSVDMVEYIVRENYTGDVFTESEMNIIKQTINDSINVYLKYPPTMVDTTYYSPRWDGTTHYEVYDVVRWAKDTVSNPAIGSLDFNSDGIVDYVSISQRGENNPTYEAFIGGILEEGFSGRGMFGFAYSPELEGKTGMYEFVGGCNIKSADIKFIKFIEGVAHEVGYLKPKMPLDDVFKVQE